MVNLDSKEYTVYLKDQIDDTIGAGVGYKYLPRLVELLPDFDYLTATILDVGVGPFTTWNWFRDNYNKRIEGIDIGDCVRKEMKKWPQEKQDNLRFIDAHIFSEDGYDLIISFHAFEHMFDLPHVLGNVFKCLRLGGYLYFSMPIPSFNLKKGHWYDVSNIDFMNKMVKAVGFRILHSELVTDLRYRPEQEMICLAQK